MSAAMERARMDQRERAQTFVERGWFPFPVEYGGKRPGVGIKWGTATASVPTAKMLDLWFGRDRMNIGIAARPSGLVILDEDRLGAMEALCATYGHPVPITYRVRTAKGWHWYFDAPEEVEIGNSPGLLKDFGFDVRGGRGDGGYVVAAGSLHATGHVYAAEDDDADTVALPWWIVGLLGMRAPAEPVNDSRSDIDQSSSGSGLFDERRQFTVAEAQEFVRPAIEELRAAGKGEINEALNRAARMVAHFGEDFWTRPEAERRLMQLQLRPWHDADESGARATIASAYASQARDAASGARDRAGQLLGWRAELVERGDPFGGGEDAGEVGEDGLTAAERVRAAKVTEALDRLEIADEARRAFNLKHQPRAEAPAAMSLAELLALPDEPIRYRVDGLLGVGGRILLAAAQKAGKTTLMGNLIRCLVDGGEFLGRHTVEPVKGRVVLLDTELPTRTLKDWLRRQGIENTDGVAVLSLRDRVTSFDLTDPATLTRWVDILASLEPGFVILDCLRPVLDAAGLDEKNEAGRFLVPFGELLGRVGVEEACLVQHMGHTGERARGDSSLLGWADANWKIVRKESEDDHSTRFFSAFGRDVDVAECELGWNSMTNELRAIGGNRRDSAARAALPAILEAIGTGKLSGRQIEAELAESDFTRAVIREALKLAIREGRVAVEDGPKASKLHSIRASAPSAP